MLKLQKFDKEFHLENKKKLENLSNDDLFNIDEILLQTWLQKAILCDRKQVLRILNYVKNVDCNHGNLPLIPTEQIIKNTYMDAIDYGDDYELIEIFIKKGASFSLKTRLNTKFDMLELALKERKYKICKVIVKYTTESLNYLFEKSHSIGECYTLIWFVNSKDLELVEEISKKTNFGLMNEKWDIHYFYNLIANISCILNGSRNIFKIFIKNGLDLEILEANVRGLYPENLRMFKKYKKQLEDEMEKEDKEKIDKINSILLGHFKDSNSLFYNSDFPLDLVKFIFSIIDLKYPKLKSVVKRKTSDLNDDTKKRKIEKN